MTLKSILRNALVTGAVSAVKKRLSTRSSRSRKQAPLFTSGRITVAAIASLLSVFGLGHWLNSGQNPSDESAISQTGETDKSGRTTLPSAKSVSTGSQGNNRGSSTGGTNSTSSATIPSANPATWEPATGPSLLVGSFNIEVFGRRKMGKSTVTDILVDIARRFDLLAIQELRSTEQGIMDEFLRLVNANGSHFRYIVGPRQGHTTSKEQYVYIYDSLKLEVIDRPYIIPDEDGHFHRPPLVVHFRSRELPPEQAFSFLALNVHTDPDDIKYELYRLQEMVRRVRTLHPQEDDVLVLGDFNAGPQYYDAFRWFERQYSAIPDAWPTTTLEKMTYDNIVFDSVPTREFTGRSGVLNFRTAYGIESLEDALDVSDHFPVWAEFSGNERRGSSLADRETGAPTR